MPLVIRIPYGGGIGAVEHHSESPEAYFCHTPGLKVVTCSNPADAYWMIQQAIASDDPIIFLEPKRRYHERAEIDEAGTPPPLHSARVVRPGTDGEWFATENDYDAVVLDVMLPGLSGDELCASTNSAQ